MALKNIISKTFWFHSQDTPSPDEIGAAKQRADSILAKLKQDKHCAMSHWPMPARRTPYRLMIWAGASFRKFLLHLRKMSQKCKTMHSVAQSRHQRIPYLRMIASRNADGKTGTPDKKAD